MIRVLLHRFISGKKSHLSVPVKKDMKRKSLHLEALEERQMLSVDPVYFDTPATVYNYPAPSGVAVNPAIADNWGVFAADFNDDGKADILSLDKSTSQVSVYLNNKGTTNIFSAAPVTFAVPAGLNSMTAYTVGKVSGDKYPDLITGFTSSSNMLTLNMYSGNGYGGFSDKVTQSSINLSSVITGTVPTGGSLSTLLQRIYLADPASNTSPLVCKVTYYFLNGSDGISSEGVATILLTNNGSGTFGTPKKITTVDDVIAYGNLNGDATMELVKKSTDGKSLEIYQESGSSATKIATVTYSSAVSYVFMLNCNSDAKMELVTTHYNGGKNSITVTTLTGSGASTTSTQKSCNVDIVPESVTAADLNNDGQVDLLISNGTVYQVLLGSSTGTFTAQPIQTANADYLASTVGDFDGDGVADVLAVGSRFATLIPGGTGKLVSNVIDFVKLGITPADIAFGDFNGDGSQDVAVLTKDGDRVYVFTSTPTATQKFSDQPQRLNNIAFGKKLLVGNFDKKFGDDLVVYGIDPNAKGPTLQTFLSDPNNASGFGSISESSLPPGFLTQFAVGDLNNDGYADIVALNDGTIDSPQKPAVPKYFIFTNDKAGAFPQAASVKGVEFGTTGSRPTAVAVGDITGDGKNDLVILNAGSKQIMVIPQGSTAGTFTSAPKNTTFTDIAIDPVACDTLLLADFNMDGKLDVLVGITKNRQFRVLVNDPASTTWLQTSSTYFRDIGTFDKGNDSSLAFAVGLVDANGSPDVVIVSGNTVIKHINTNKTGAQLGQVTLVFRSYDSTIVNTETGDLTTLNKRLTYIDEWSNFYVEIWANTASAVGISEYTTVLQFNSSVFEVRDAVASTAFSTGFTKNTSVAGKITLSGKVVTGSALQGDNTNTLLARVSFKPVAGTKASGVETNGLLLNYKTNKNYPAPVFNGFSIDVTATQLKTTTGLAGKPTASQSNNIPLIPVVFDINDDGVVNMNDFALFYTALTKNTAVGNANAVSYIRIVDFDYNGTINMNDFGAFYKTLAKWPSRDACRLDTSLKVDYPSAFITKMTTLYDPIVKSQTQAATMSLMENAGPDSAELATATPSASQSLLSAGIAEESLSFVEENVAVQTTQAAQNSAQLLADQAMLGYIGSQPQKSNEFFTEELADSQDTLAQLIREGKM